LPEFEHQAVGWQAGQHQPDPVAAVVAFDVLSHSIVEPNRIVSPIDVARRKLQGQLPPPPLWMRRRLGSERAWPARRTIERMSDVLSWILRASAVSA
jgi:hypothetical protein